MKIRVFVDSASLYSYVEIDTSSLLVSYISSTGYIKLLSVPGIYSTSGDPMPSVFINDLINDLIDKN